MYTVRLTFSAVLALIAIIINQYIKGIPNFLDPLTLKFNSFLLNIPFYDVSHILALKVALLMFVPITLVEVFSIVYKLIYKKKFNYKISTSWLIWLVLAIPYVFS